MAAAVTDDFWRKIWDDGADNPGEPGWMVFIAFPCGFLLRMRAERGIK